MAAGTLLTVLSNIPWGQVVDNAPKLAEGAARLWNAVRRKKGDADAGGSPLETLQARVAALEEQVQASSELIKALAEQNARLVQTVERERRRLTRLAIASAASAALLAAALALLFLR